MPQNSQQFWAQTWSRHFDDYARNWGRQAYYLRFILHPDERQLLELGAGSFRDTVRLNQWGYDCLGTDFSDEAVARARRRYSDYAHCIHAMDATRLDVGDHSVDLSFHNGFFVLFDDDALIGRILAEQARVSRRRIVCTVHNALNRQQVERFRQLKQTDNLYDVRFFEPDEIRALLAPYCRHVKLFPFGHRLLDRSIRYLNRIAPLDWMYQRIRARDIEQAERIMAVGYLN
ncbi:MAG: class I SAM-dependent methyltransferase [Pirellulales bacterium]